MRYNKILIVFFSLLAIHVATAKSLDEDLSFGESSIEYGVLSRNARSISSSSINEVKVSIKSSISNLTDSIVGVLQKTEVGRIIIEALTDTPKFASRVNTLLGKDVLILNEKSLKISFRNLSEVVKLQTFNILENHLKLRGFILMVVEDYISKTLDNVVRKIEPATTRVLLTISEPEELEVSEKSPVKKIIEKLILQVGTLLLKPFQSKVNQTLLSVTNELLNLYQPVLPNNYFQSIITCVVNQTVMKAVDVIEAIRDMINNLLTSQDRTKRSVDVTEDDSTKKHKSLIGLIVEPIRILIAIILTPAHRLLKTIMNYTFITLRPFVGKIILSPIENIVMAIISLIPCYKCY